MATVDGLRPTQPSRPTLRQNTGRVGVRYSTEQQVGLRPSAAPVSSFVRPAAPAGVGNDALLLANSLADLSPALAKIAHNTQVAEAQKQKSVDELYKEKMDQIAADFSKDKEVGAVSLAQAGQLAPDASPIIRARIAQAIGRTQAKQWIQDRIQGILENDNVRLNTANRTAEIDKIRAEATGMAGDNPDNAFYGSGFVDQVNKSLSEFETGWQRETASYHQKIQADDFASSVEEALKNGGDLVQLDKTYGESSSLNPLERKKVVMDTALSTAIANQDKGMLDRIPQLFLNADYKEKIAKAKEQIDNARFAKWSQGKQIQEYQRTQAIRQAKLSALQRMASGEDINPADYAKQPEVFEFVANNISKPFVNPTVSARNAAFIRDRVMQAGITGNFTDALGDQFAKYIGGDESKVNTETLQDYVMNLNGISGADRQKLIDEMPQLMDGVNFMRDPYVTSTFKTVEDDIKAFMNNPLSKVVTLQGINPQTEVRRTYQQYIQQELYSDLEEGKGIPTGRRKVEILRAAEDAALQKLNRIQQMVKHGGDQSQANTTTTPTQPADSGVKTVNFGDLK